ncbi:MAG: hypothetical protein MN733_08785 [Nitrososphaera sp.]|nr:hypothetical protein [Nitrososphaera sp.]
MINHLICGQRKVDLCRFNYPYRLYMTYPYRRLKVVWPAVVYRNEKDGHAYYLKSIDGDMDGRAELWACPVFADQGLDIVNEICADDFEERLYPREEQRIRKKLRRLSLLSTRREKYGGRAPDALHPPMTDSLGVGKVAMNIVHT